MANTGQKFIYTGCAKGRVVIYDMLTGKEVKYSPGVMRLTSDDVSGECAQWSRRLCEGRVLAWGAAGPGE